MDKLRVTLWLQSSLSLCTAAAIMAVVSSLALAVGETPSSELLNPRYNKDTSSFIFTLFNRERIPRDYQLESELYEQGTIIAKHQHELQPKFDEVKDKDKDKDKEKLNFALFATLSISIKEVDPGNNGIYSLRVVAS